MNDNIVKHCYDILWNTVYFDFTYFISTFRHSTYNKMINLCIYERAILFYLFYFHYVSDDQSSDRFVGTS